MAIIVKDTFIGPANTHLNGGHKADTGQDWTQSAGSLGNTYVGFCLDGSGKCKNDQSYSTNVQCCFVDSGYSTGIIISANIYNPTNYDGLEFWDTGGGWGSCYAFAEWAAGVIYLWSYGGTLVGTASYSPSSGDLWEVDLGVTIPGHLICKIAGNVLFNIAMTFPVYTNHGLINYPSGSNSSLRWSNFQIQTPSYPPTISNLSVTDGSTAGGYDTIITGTNFTGTTAVNFGSTPATAFTINSATQITATVPAHVAGAVNVSVTNPDGTATLTNGFTYHTPTLSACTPSFGSDGGGTSITNLTGQYLTGATSVTFGGTVATGFTVVNDTKITCTTPAHAAGAVDVIAINSIDSGTLASGYTYLVYSVTGVAPGSGSTAGGTALTLTGVILTGVTDVKIGGISATSIVVVNDTTITCVSPAHTAGPVDIFITGPNGNYTLHGGFTYQAATLADIELLPEIEPKLKMLAILRNVANQSEGAIVTSSTDDYSADFPKEGANDGQATLLTYGAPTGVDNGDGDVIAEDGIGQGGWRSSSAASSNAINTAAGWTGGTQTNISTIGDEIEEELTNSYYQQDFNGLTPNTALAGQDSWVAVATATPTIQVKGGADTYNGYGVQIYYNGNVGHTEIKRAITNLNTSGNHFLSFRIKQKNPGAGADTFSLMLYDNSAATVRWGMLFYPTKITDFSGKSLSLLPALGSNVWQKMVVQWNSTTPSTSSLTVWLDGKQVHSGTVNLTNINELRLWIDEGTGQTEYWIDEIRTGNTLISTAGTQENIFDLGSNCPVDVNATFQATGEVKRCEQITQPFNSLANNNTPISLRNISTYTNLAQTFIANATVQIDGAYVEAYRYGTPNGSLWVELRTTSGGSPTSIILARSKSLSANDLQTVAGVLATNYFEFGGPYVLQSGATYALVLCGDFDVNASNFVYIFTLNSGSGVYYYNGSSWTTLSNYSIGYILISFTQIEEVWDSSHADSIVRLGYTPSEAFIGQGFQVAYDCQFRHCHLWIGMPSVAVFQSTNRFWVELQSDDGTGKPSNTVLATSLRYDPSKITWTAYQWFCMTFPIKNNLTAGTQYHLVLKCNWNLSTSNFLRSQGDITTHAYGKGTMSTSDNSTIPVWTSSSPSDLIFRVMTECIPFFRYDAAYSTDNANWTSYAKFNDNQTKAGSLSAFSFQGQLKRYWKVRAQLVRVSTNGLDMPWTPCLNSYTLKVLFNTSKFLTLDFGVSRVISRVEIYAHPLKGGCRNFKLQSSINGSSWADITAIDAATLEARAKGGGATVTFTSPVIVATGDFIGINFSNDQTMRYLKVIIYGNSTVDEYARILEIKAYRVMDISDRVNEFTVSHQSDFLSRRIQAKSITLSLRNDDRYLSTQGTTGGYNGELGRGMRLIPYVSFKGAQLWEKQGVFYVDKWSQQSKSATVDVTARDGVKVMSTDVQAKYKAGYTNDKIIEYLGNLAGIPSQDMKLDQVAQTIDYFMPLEGDAYQEAQNVAEAACLSTIYFDKDGYLVFKAMGNISGNTRLESLNANIRKTWGPPVQLGSLLYVVVSIINGANDDFHLAYYNLDTLTWTLGSAVIFSVANTDLWYYFKGAVPFVWNNSLYILVQQDTNIGSWTNPGSQITTFLDLYQYDGVSAFTKITKINSNQNYGDDWYGLYLRGISFCISKPVLVDQNYVYIPFWNATLPPQNNLLWVNMVDFSNGTTASLYQTDGICKENGIILLCGCPHVNNWEYYLYSLNPDNMTIAQQLLIDNTVVGETSLGMVSTGKGYVYLSLVATAGGSIPGQVIKITIPTYTLTKSNIACPDTQGTDYWDGGAAQYINGYFLSLSMRQPKGMVGSTNTYERHMIGMNDADGKAVDLGLFTLGSSKVGPSTSFYYDGDFCMYFLVDLIRMIKISVRDLLQLSTEAVKTISGRPAGIETKATLEDGDEAGGLSTVINMAIIKSQPLISQDIATVWEGQNLPWGVQLGSKLSFSIQLSDPCIPPQSFVAATPTFDQGGAGTAYLSKDIQQPTITIDITASGRLTDIKIEGHPLKATGTLVAIVAGSKSSQNKYGIVQYTLQNDYIYDTLAQSLIGQSLVTRFQDPSVKISNFESFALWDIKMFDQVTVIDDELEVNCDFYVTSFAHAWKKQTTTYGLQKV